MDLISNCLLKCKTSHTFGNVNQDDLVSKNDLFRFQEKKLKIFEIRTLIKINIFDKIYAIRINKILSLKLTLRSGDTLTNDRLERWCYC